MTSLPRSWAARHRDARARNLSAALTTSAGTVRAPALREAAAPRQRLTYDEQTAALVMLLAIAVSGSTAPDAIPDDPERDLEAAVWTAAAERRHLDDPGRWLARVGYLVEASQRQRARRTKAAA
jgi:hypothetical protein